MTAAPPTYAAQADAVERAAVGQRGYVNRLRELAAKDDKRTLEFETQAAWTPALVAAAVTMRRVANLPPGVLKAAVEAHRNALAEKSKGAEAIAEKQKARGSE